MPAIRSICAVNSKHAFLFRRLLHRKAAWHVQFPGDRGKVHAPAISALEAFAGGRPPAALLREIGESAELGRRSATMRAACAKTGIPPFDGLPA